MSCSNNFIRVVGEKELSYIEKNKAIPLSEKEWYPYEANTVIFLFDAHKIGIKGLFERISDNLENYDSCGVIRFRWSNAVVEHDISGDWKGAFVARTEILLEDCGNVEIYRITKSNYISENQLIAKNLGFE